MSVAKRRRAGDTAVIPLLAVTLGAFFVLPAGTGFAGDPGSVAYPDNPSGMPAATDGGKPVAPSGKVCATPGCPDVPGPGLGSAGNDTGKNQQPGIRTPTAAYPGNPQQTPATTAEGKAPK